MLVRTWPKARAVVAPALPRAPPCALAFSLKGAACAREVARQSEWREGAEGERRALGRRMRAGRCGGEACFRCDECEQLRTRACGGAYRRAKVHGKRARVNEVSCERKDFWRVLQRPERLSRAFSPNRDEVTPPKVNHSALLADITFDSNERAKYNMYSAFCAVLG